MFKRVIIVVIVAALVLGSPLFAGGAGEEGAVKTQLVNVASTFPADSPQDKGLNVFKKIIEEKSNGRF